jgi:hypothetical protein
VEVTVPNIKAKQMPIAEPPATLRTVNVAPLLSTYS